MLKKLANTVAGVLLLPILVGGARAFYNTLSALDSFVDVTMILERGALAYLVMHVIIMRPVYLYILGHEGVHVLATWLCGGKVESFNVTPQGGSVATSKTNWFIELSPYFVPIYTLLLGPIFMIVRFTGVNPAELNQVFLFFVGFTLAFHFVMTTEVLKMEQPDIAKSGFIFSMVVIVVLNLTLTVGVFCPFFPGVSFIEFMKDMFTFSFETYSYLYEKITTVVSTFTV
jgi:hypothetical protein